MGTVGFRSPDSILAICDQLTPDFLANSLNDKCNFSLISARLFFIRFAPTNILPLVLFLIVTIILHLSYIYLTSKDVYYGKRLAFFLACANFLMCIGHFQAVGNSLKPLYFLLMEAFPRSGQTTTGISSIPNIL